MNHEVYSYIGGLIWLDTVNSKMMGLQSESLYERDKLDAMREFLQPGMTFVDAGACVGYFSLYAAKLVGSQGKVIAFEPEPVNCGWLKRNKHLNSYKSIVIFECALGSNKDFDVIGKTMLSLTKHPGQHSLTPKKKREYEYPVIVRTLDNTIINMDAIKIDVQGYDLNVLIGAERLLSANKDMLLMMDLHPSLGVDCEKVRRFISNLGYSITSDSGKSIIARKYAK